MRGLLPFLLLGAALWCARWSTPAAARPEFARREGKACGTCHINPRGGGPRNQRGLEYARNEFSFPPQPGNLNSFTRERDRDAMVRARKLIDVGHTRVAVEQLQKLLRAVKRDEAARRLVEDEIHDLEVRGTEILGRARLLVRGKDPDEGVELLVLLVTEFKDLEVGAEAKRDLSELARDKENKERVRKEQGEARARLAYLDALVCRVDGDEEKCRKELAKVEADHPGTRAAEDAHKVLHPEEAEKEEKEQKEREKKDAGAG